MPNDTADEIARVFTTQIREIADGTVEIKAIARKPGDRTKVAVVSHDPKIDCIGVCVGERGCRIMGIVEHFDGERFDLVRWNDSLEKLIPCALLPAEILQVVVRPAQHRATVVVEEDQLSVALGRRGLNRELASRLCACEIDIVTRAELDQGDVAPGG